MRFSLRTLLALEDNVFDVEQHQRLEQLLAHDTQAENTLHRIRYVMRNPMLGVPGLIDQREELDPNYVAEYLDHQMSKDVQENFEAYCLSTDKYLAEIASIHHVLTNVLGEPAQTSRDCRLKCYEACNAPRPLNQPPQPHQPQTQHFHPQGVPQESAPAKNMPFWQRWFPQRTAPQVTHEPNAPGRQASSPIWTFLMIGMCICTLLFGWQQIEKKAAENKRQTAESQERDSEVLSEYPPVRSAERPVSSSNPYHQIVPQPDVFYHVAATPFAQSGHSTPAWEQPDSRPAEPIQQTGYAMPTAPTENVAVSLPDDPFAVSVGTVPQTVLPDHSDTDNPFQHTVISEVEVPEVAASIPAGRPHIDEPATEPLPTELPLTTAARLESPSDRVLPEIIRGESIRSNDAIIAFQPIQPVSRSPIDSPSAVPPAALPPRAPVSDSSVPQARPPYAIMQTSMQASTQMPDEVPDEAESPESVVPAEIVETEVALQERPILGRTISTNYPSVIFSADSVGDGWQLPDLPFDIHAEQYLLTSDPFRGTFELADSFRIEMIGDAKLCILPLDENGLPGIFVDYGRIIIRPLRPNQSLRIAMERARGTVSVQGTESTLFIDSFSEITIPATNARASESQGPKTSPILGFVPRQGEQIVWQADNQIQPFQVTSQGGMMLQSERYEFGQVILANWLGTMSIQPEHRMLAELCRQSFAEAAGDDGRALDRLIRHEFPSVRVLGLRLCGDLGDFTVPLKETKKLSKEEEPIRNVLNQYFEAVLRRDAETLQRLADAIENVRQVER